MEFENEFHKNKGLIYAYKIRRKKCQKSDWIFYYIFTAAQFLNQTNSSYKLQKLLKNTVDIVNLCMFTFANLNPNISQLF